jgi:predicted glycoside hydrolase/deacetylase ChbG (UPF0249 family)
VKRLIVNADDLGLTAGVTRSIVQAIERGLVTSASAMPCFDGSLARIGALPSEVHGKVGVHLQLTAGAPVLPPDRVPSLVDSSGSFPRRVNGELRVDQDEVFREWCAQVDAVAGCGISPIHIDSHHSVHKDPLLVDVYCAVARHYGLKARSGSRALAARIKERGVVCPDFCEASWSLAAPTLDGLREKLRGAFAEADVVELVTHPGYVDGEIRRISGYSDGRDDELGVLCAAGTERALEEMGVVKIGFGDL